MIKNILSVFAVSVGYAITVTADVVMIPFYLVDALKNITKEKMQ